MSILNHSINLPEGLYIKDPNSSELGQKIIAQSIEMIHEIGFENFNFKKLGLSIHSNESSIYRYFNSKHSLMLYLINWYWAWMEYRILNAVIRLNSPEEKLITSLEIITTKVSEDNTFTNINEVLLQHIMIVESSKIYHTKEIDEENKKGFYKGYKNVVGLIASFIEAINPNYCYAKALVTTVIEGAHHQYYFSDHFPTLSGESAHSITDFYQKLVFKTIQK